MAEPDASARNKRSTNAPGDKPRPLPDLNGLGARAALVMGAHYLSACGVADSASDARRLLMHASGLSSLDLVRGDDNAVLPSATAVKLAAALERRGRREPVARIIGERWFYGRAFTVTPATLDPRPDTETLIEAALTLVREGGFDPAALNIADIGTGTGCIVLTLLAELPGARGVGIDVSAAALEVARANALRVGVADRVTFHEGPCLAGLTGPFQLVVSNPPYIPHADIVALDAEVAAHDPLVALDGGPDGLDIYRAIAAELAGRARDGWAIFEVGAGQADDVARLLHQAWPTNPAPDTRFFKDLGGIDRCVAMSTQY